MAVKIRLARRGRKARAMYDIVVADSRSPRDGRFIEKLGNYNPNTNPATIVLNEESAFDWVMKGAQPTDTARAILSYRGVMMKKHLQVGVNKGAISQEEADKRYAEWLKAKENKIQKKVEGLSKAEAAAAKARFEAETKVKEARAAEIQKKQQVVEEETVVAETEASAEVAEAEVADSTEVAVEETPVAETAEETPVEEAEPKAEVKEEVPAAEASEEAPAEEEENSPAPEASENKKAE
ncbi:MAG: 30S ribosomal protein S16 [Cyclobacteriaceae bacterium]|nr:30S ribosomal protein S16 [Cyclobacteriaceae bacterium]